MKKTTPATFPWSHEKRKNLNAIAKLVAQSVQLGNGPGKHNPHSACELAFSLQLHQFVQNFLHVTRALELRKKPGVATLVGFDAQLVKDLNA